ncbi:MAG TPA: DUF1990 domain-containing protein [Micromonosporaceae bacterium]|nr:DUF1990 domain-containing protein [Micromonosporaceae bacterium]
MGLLGRGPSLAALASAELTYPEVGATRGVLPAGYDHAYRDAPLGVGPAVFQRAAGALLGWQMQRRAGLRVTASSPEVRPDAVVVLTAGWWPLRMVAPCRVVYRIDEPDRRGFAYGTLPGHPERGEEAFFIELRPDGEVRFLIRVFSRPASLLARAGGPLTRKVQAIATDRYVRAMQRLARP